MGVLYMNVLKGTSKISLAEMEIVSRRRSDDESHSANLATIVIFRGAL